MPKQRTGRTVGVEMGVVRDDVAVAFLEKLGLVWLEGRGVWREDVDGDVGGVGGCRHEAGRGC